ncbi:redoxin family protein [Candidatus Bathyarchaeota archaeon]|nr:redoxin family protein [Candidatus Bathyarchaeota archaeon]
MSAVFEIKYPFGIGEQAPYFEGLPNIDGKLFSLSSFNDKEVVVLIFLANRCPTARVYTDRLKAIQNDYESKDAQLVGINSDNQYFFPLNHLGKWWKSLMNVNSTFPI